MQSPSAGGQGPNTAPIVLGLRQNWAQFSLLVLVNAFVGGMVGAERVVLPLLAEREFGIVSQAAILSFIVTFGLVKALANLIAGKFSDRIGRKRILVAGWLFGLPLPALILIAPNWHWVVLANMLLGINQGLCWSTTVIMKIDLVGPRRRGLALGLNEASGYGAVALAALVSGFAAARYGLRLAPFYMGETFAIAGLVLSVFLVRDTQEYAKHESTIHVSAAPDPARTTFEIFRVTSWKDRTLFSASQAGFVNNLNDGMAWGLLPLYFASHNLTLQKVAFLSALYPAVWSIAQLGTGSLSDVIGRKKLIAGGMIVQGLAIFIFAITTKFSVWATAASFLGLGTAMVYPTLLAVVSDVAHPSWRASAVGVYRLWRDAGYAAGALLAGFTADLFGVSWAIVSIAVLTVLSGVLVSLAMSETVHERAHRTPSNPAS